MDEDLYRALAKHLDRLPGGFPETPNGLEQRILRRLFTTEQAQLALHLTLIPESTAVVARRAGLPVNKTARLLEEMAHKGLIYDFSYADKASEYMAYQFVVGIWEFQVNLLDADLVRDFGEYIEWFFDPHLWKENPQLRTIPVGESIPNPSEILPYEQAEKIIDSHSKFAVADCICRKERQMAGESCDKPLETCIILGQGADYYQRHGMGRPISKADALEILAIANQTGLVLQPANSKVAGSICCCCGDCCGVLRSLKRFPQPGTLVSCPYYAVVEPDLCAACETCIDRCQMEAIQVDGTAQINMERCIGCGLCVSTCETGALALVRKPAEEQPYIPKNTTENLFRLGCQRGVIKTPDLVMMALRSKLDRFLALR